MIKIIITISVIMLNLSIMFTCYALEKTGFTVSLSNYEIHQGDVALIKITPTSNIKSASFIFNQHESSFFKNPGSNNLCAFLAIDLAENPGKRKLPLNIIKNDGSEITKSVNFKVIKKNFKTQKLTLPESKVTLSKKNLKRYKLERSALKAAFNKYVPSRLWNKNFTKPVSGKINTPFGVKRIINNKPKNPHSGIDMKASEGTPVTASNSGIVVLECNHFFTGNSVYINHGTGITSMYFHLSRICVKQGQQLSRGEVIGYVGSTGRSTGPHLHWGIRINNQRIDPVSLLEISKTFN